MSGEEVVHLWEISKGFWMAQTQMTQAQWEAVMGSNPSHFKGAQLPVESVTWEDAVACVEKLNGLVVLPMGWKLALPSEAQWEYACRAGTKTPFSFGNQLGGKQANCNGERPYGTWWKKVPQKGPYLGKTVDVGKYAANAWGLYDMHGNVWEWCADWYDGTLQGGLDPKGPAAGPDRVFRGGSWYHDASYCRAGFRGRYELGLREDILGFRVAAIPIDRVRYLQGRIDELLSDEDVARLSESGRPD